MPKKRLPEWDLTDLYSGLDDPQLKKDKKEIKKLVREFNKQYKGKINSDDLTANFLYQCLEDYVQILEKIILYNSYFRYLFYKNTQSEKISKLRQQADELYTWVEEQTLWLELEWLKLDDKKAREILDHKKIKEYQHYLTHSRIFKPYRLSEKEEQILTKKSQTSNHAFVQLYDLIDNGIEFELTIDGKTKKLNSSELSPYLTSHPDREIRQKAAGALTKGIKKHKKLFSFILNKLLLDKKINDKLRGHKYPEQSTFLSYEVSKKTVDNLTKTIKNNYSIPERFYQTKKKILNYKELYEWDRYSSLYGIDKEYSWKKAKDIILNSFDQFSPQFSQTAKKFFNNHWIDAKITKGKRSGAFCSYGTPSSHPYILVNYTGKIKDVLTLAHELGHGIHHYLSRDQKMLEYWSSTAVAEIASVFAESLVFENLYHQINDKKIKMDLLADHIQSAFATIFRQNAFYLYENDIHHHYRKKGELSIEEFSNYYQQRLQATFGNGLKLTDQHQFWWMPILHFYHFNFYVFTYAMGNLITYGLINQYKKDSSDFVGQYINALKLGGSKKPKNIIATMGLDIEQKDFWQQGLDYLDQLVVKFEALAND
jgi:oligoendopeptidase F